MERHKCKLCSRTFANGRALGGHMKAHLATLPLPPKPEPFNELADPEFSLAPDTGFVVQDRESETESKNPTRQRSKRNRKSSLMGSQNQNLESKKPKLSFMVSTPPPPSTEPEPLSSVSDTSPEEDVAMCLMMLSRDKWRRKNNGVEVEQQGQALGGHKRSHLIPSSSSIANVDSVRLKESFIDLNLPAPLEEDDLSVVSDA
ncbi:Zinc finger C2H2-type [Sesbania bispinosa]|nr:Zinc finger C2H2-type [Sesbania bispinosa]